MLWNRQDSYLHPGTGFFCNDDVRMGIKKVLKPLSKQRFFRNMKDAVDLYNTMTVKIPVETKQGVHTLPASSVIAVEAQGRKVTVHTTLCDFESIHNIQYWLELLPKNRFFQTHPTEKTCRAMRFIFYPVLRVTVRIDMDQYHFIFFAVTYILMHLMKKTWNLQIAFLQFFCIMEVRGGGTCLWRYPEHPDSSKAGFTAFERPKDREPRSGDCENQ